MLSIRFIPDYGLKKGIWFSIFHSISAFCNAGFDLLGNQSISLYSESWLVCLTLMLLIIIGGLGFTVWNDIIENIKNKKKLNQLTVHTKIVLIMTGILLIGGTIFILVFESNNISIMQNDTLRSENTKSCFSINNFEVGRFL